MMKELINCMFEVSKQIMEHPSRPGGVTYDRALDLATKLMIIAIECEEADIDSLTELLADESMDNEYLREVLGNEED